MKLLVHDLQRRSSQKDSCDIPRDEKKMDLLLVLRGKEKGSRSL